ncbi:MAG: PhoH family protein [Alphaproteobacteria bacterium]|nr:MAG: PhoH family protein [Alphaproteobacteria bacterium]
MNMTSRPKRRRPTGRDPAPVLLQFDDNTLLPLLYGEHDQNLSRVEHQLGVHLASRGNRLAISGPPEAVEVADRALTALYERLRKGLDVDESEVDAAVRMARQMPGTDGSADAGAGVGDIHADELVIRTRKRHVTPRSPNQAAYIRALNTHELVFAIGPAGTGKTYLAVAMAVSLMMEGRVDRIILSRPAVEAGERLGFLPGDLREKVDPYLRPLYDALYDMLPAQQVMSRLSNGEIEVAPLAFMRGRTLSNAFVILDEAQNTTPVQMKMFLTRLGENSRMAVTGDLSQVDLPAGQPSGLQDAVDLLTRMDNVAFVRFTNVDVMRHSLVTRIVRAYEARENGGKGSAGGPKPGPGSRAT